MSCCNSSCNHDPCGSSFNQLFTKAAQYAQYTQSQAVAAKESEVAAEAAQAAAEAAAAQVEGFESLYLGAKDVPPAVDNEGNPLQEGALYFNTVILSMYVWDGTNWITASNVTGFNEATDFLATGSVTPENLKDRFEDIDKVKDFPSYEFTATGTTAPRNLQDRFADVINVKDFGAVGDWDNATQTGTDDTAAIQGALTYALTSGKRSAVFLPSGNYRVTNTLTISSIDSGIIGSGMGIPTRITADHSNGPVIRMIGERQYVKNLTITSSSLRQSGPSGSGTNINCGILQFPGSGLSRYVEIKKVSIGSQPSHGLVVAGTTNSSEYSLLSIQNNIGHGIVFSNGKIVDQPTVIAAAGLSILSTSNIFDNGGNGIVIGETDDGNMPVRIDINNCEFGRNATNSSTRRSLYQADVFGRQIVFNTCAFTSVSQFTGGIKISGTGLFLKANRFLNISKAIFVESYPINPTRGVTIEEVHVTDVSTQVIPAIDINDLAKDVYVDSSNIFSIGALVSQDRKQKNSSKKIIYKVTDQIINNSSILTGDDSLMFSINKAERKSFRFVILYKGDASAGLKLNISRPSASQIYFCTPSSTVINLSNTIDIQDIVGVGGIITAGCDSSKIRSIELIGTVTTFGLPGDVQLFWSQNTAHASDLTIYGESFLEFI